MFAFRDAKISLIDMYGLKVVLSMFTSVATSGYCGYRTGVFYDENWVFVGFQFGAKNMFSFSDWTKNKK